MKATVLYGPRDVRFEEREMPGIEKPTDAVIRISPCWNVSALKNQ